jgi:2-amino-4-hydroxy-6-hydroxymethyldihydropteridine diphosphokinase
LGSNLGDRAGHLRAAVAALREQAGATVFAASAIYATDPVGIAGAPVFFNAAIGLRTALSADELLTVCLAIEAAQGRRREPGAGWASRTLDIDLLLYGDLAITTPRLTLPHPRLAQRAFVLVPLAEIAPEFNLLGRTLAAWAALVGDAGVRPTGERLDR